MSYFTAVIAGDGRTWRARDIDVEDAGSLEDLADTLRGASHRGGPVLAVIEREDEWFALVRVDGEEDPRLFVSDMDAAARSPYAELLAPAADIEVDLPARSPVGEGADPQEEQAAQDGGSAEDDELGGKEQDGVPGDDEPPALEVEPWAGEPDLLEDLGLPGGNLRELVVERSDDPAGVLAEVGEVCGFGELLDALR